MTVRTSTKTVTFKQPFTLRGLDRELPAGDYTVETDEELIQGLSFPVFRRVLTQIHLPTVEGHPGCTQVLRLEPQDLDDALARENIHLVVTEDRKVDHG